MSPFLRSLAVTVLVATLALAPAPLASAEAAAAPATTRIRLQVTAVKAGPAVPGQPQVAPELEKVAAKLKRLPFGHYEPAGVTTKQVAAGESVTIPFGGTGRWTVVPRAMPAGVVQVEIQVFGPGADEPCLVTTATVEPGMANITFCDGVPDPAATLIFIALADISKP